MVLNVLEFSIKTQPPLGYYSLQLEGGRIYVIEFSRIVSIVHVMLNKGPEGQRPHYLQAVKATRPELQINVKAVFCQKSKMF